MKLIESDLNEWLVPQYDDRLYFCFDYVNIPALSERTKRTYENVTSAVREGIMTRNEAREQLGLSAIEGGDDIYIAGNLFPLGSELPSIPDVPDNDEDVEDYVDDLDDESKAISFKPTESMAAEAMRGLKWREQFGRGGTNIGSTRASQLIKRENLSADTVKRMYSFFSRHEVDKQGKGFNKGEDGYPSNGRIAWALWGGDAGFSWSTQKRNQLMRQEDADEKAEVGSVKVGDMVSWDSSGGRARGKIKKIAKTGKVAIPNTSLTITATEDAPVALITLYRGGEATDIVVGHKIATLRKL